MALDNVKEKAKKVWEFVKTFSDYILIGVGEVIAQVVGELRPFAQLFSLSDPTISFPKAEDARVSAFMLYILSLAVPVAVVLVIGLAIGPGKFTRRLSFVNWSILGIGISVVLTQIFTEMIKVVVGRPRPDFLSRCQPDPTQVQAVFNTTAVTLFDAAVCTNTDAGDINSGFRSFPSGHASQSFAGLTFLALWLAGRLQLFVSHSRHGKHIYAYAIPAGPLLLASFIATTRISDFRHRGSDVFGGTLIGIFWAIVSYRYYFPWVTSPIAGTPWMILREESQRGVLPQTREPLLPSADGQATRSAPEFSGTPTPYSDMPAAYSVAGNPMELHPLTNSNMYTPPHAPPPGSH